MAILEGGGDETAQSGKSQSGLCTQSSQLSRIRVDPIDQDRNDGTSLPTFDGVPDCLVFPWERTRDLLDVNRGDSAMLVESKDSIDLRAQKAQVSVLEQAVDEECAKRPGR